MDRGSPLDSSFEESAASTNSFSYTNPSVGGTPTRPPLRRPDARSATKAEAAQGRSGNPQIIASNVVIHQNLPAYELVSYARIAGIGHLSADSAHGCYFSTGDLPQVQHGQALVGSKKALTYLRTVSEPLGDASLSQTSRADASVWISLVHNTLNDLLLWSLLFSGTKNVCTAVRLTPEQAAEELSGSQSFLSGLKSLASAFSPRRTAWPLIGLLSDFLSSGFAVFSDREAVYLQHRGLGLTDARWAEQVAAASYKALATRYQTRAAAHEGPFFFGRQPSTLDAVVFGHLASSRCVHPISVWVKKYAFPALAPFFQAFASTFFFDDPLLGQPLYRSLDPRAVLADASAASDVALAVAHPSIAQNGFRQREALYLERLRRLLKPTGAVEDEEAAHHSLSADQLVAAFPFGFGATPELLGLPRSYRIKAQAAFPASSDDKSIALEDAQAAVVGAGAGAAGATFGEGGNVWLNLLFVVAVLGIGTKIAFHGAKSMLARGK